MAIAIEEHERAALLEEIARFAGSLTGDEARTRYVRLRGNVETGQVDDDQIPALEKLLEIALDSGAVRRIHGPGAERILLDLFRRTPRGAALDATVTGANRALEALAGQHLERVSLQRRLPGAYRLTVETDRCRLSLDLDRDGVHGRDVEMAI